jgi:hypothetical protein
MSIVELEHGNSFVAPWDVRMGVDSGGGNSQFGRRIFDIICKVGSAVK